ncbi:MAG: MFS transporter [Bacteroidetes bacterium]|nr:MFS transporter [Bacteroidota bacterium]
MTNLIKILNLNRTEKRTFRLHTFYLIIEGVVLGILALNEFVFLKSLNGTNYQLSFLFQFSMLVFLFLIVINEFLKRIRNRKKLLRLAAIFSRLPLLALIFFPTNTDDLIAHPYYHYIFLFLFLIYFSGNIFINPNINYLLKVNYRHQNFGKLYSYSTSINKIVMLVVTFAYGYILDYNNFAFVYIIPMAALLGISSVFVLSNISYPKDEIILLKKSVIQSVKDSIKDMHQILRNNTPYRHFEIGFMFYGFSFMISVTVITIYFYEALNLNYASVAFYRNAYNILAIILLPFFGRLISNIDPRKFAALTYSSIVIYIFFLMMTSYFPAHFEFLDITIYYTLLLYILFHGIFAATMVLLWNIGSAYFCKPEESGTYQSLHLSLTGVRAIFAPLSGVVFYELFGFTVTFSIAIFSLLCGIALMIWSYNQGKTFELNE